MERIRQITGIVLFFMIVAGTFIYTQKTRQVSETRQQLEEQVLTAKTNYTIAKYQLKTKNLARNNTALFYGILASAGTILSGYLFFIHRKTLPDKKTANIVYARIGKHSEIPVDARHVREFEPIAVNLSLAEIESSISEGTRRTSAIYLQAVRDTLSYTKHLGRAITNQTGSEPQMLPEAATIGTPTFADLLRSGTVAPNKPLVIGYTNGQPERRAMKDLKAVALGGWQGSGKTRSAAYLIASSVLAYHAQAYIVDPHRGHKESLSHLIQPLEHTKQIKIVNPFDLPKLITFLNTKLDRRLRGDESSKRSILLVIDELARLAKMEYFDELVTFLERCTAETRKANIVFLGISPKWTARHFKGRADIRGCMNSTLVHKCKESQAELLLEGKEERQLIKEIRHPGEAILTTDFANAQLVRIPFCVREDMEVVAQQIGQKDPVVIQSEQIDTPKDKKLPTHNAPKNAGEGHEKSESEPVPVSHTHTEEHTVHTAEVTGEVTNSQPFSDEELLRKIQEKKAGGVSVSQMARDLKFDRTYLSKWLNGNEDMTDTLRDKLQHYVHASNAVTFPNETLYKSVPL